MMPQHFQDQQIRMLRRSDEPRREHEEATLKDLRLSHISKFVSTLNALSPDWTKENPQLHSQTEELLINLMFDSPLAISAVAQDMGIVLSNDQLIRTGATVARLYRGKHRTEPPKKQRGEDHRVNAYTEADRDLIVTALKQVTLDNHGV